MNNSRSVRYGEAMAITVLATVMVLLLVVPQYERLYAYLGGFFLGWIPGFLYVWFHKPGSSHDRQ